jgi:DNA-directed RNA polymerase subunit beta
MEVRDVHPTHYGRICAIETPEGANIGLISSLATYSIVNKYGFIETPYRKVVDGVITEDIEFLDANQEYKYYISQIDKNAIDGNKISKELVSARHKGEFMMVNSASVQYMDVSLRQTVSVVTALIPFLENDDAKRALMGSNMQRQAVPLITSEAPLVGTGMEHIVAADSGALILAQRAGKVVIADANRIVVRVCDANGNFTADMDTYHLTKFARSNNSTCINQVPVAKVGDDVKVGDVLVDGPATDNGEIALGKNLLVAFMPWNGYNFEDSIVISEKIVHNDVFTSIHIEEFEITVRDTRLGVEEVTRDIPSVVAENVVNLDENGIIHVGVNVKTGDILVGKVTPKSESPITAEEKLLRAIFGEKIAEVKDSSMRVPPGVSGTVIGVNILTKRGNEKDARALQIEQDEVMTLKKSHDYDVATVDAFFGLEIAKVLGGKEVTYVAKGRKKMTEVLSFGTINAMSSNEKLHLKCSDVSAQQAVDNIKAQHSLAVKKMQDNFNARVASVIDGGDLQAGVLKVIRVYVAVRSKLQPGDKMAGRHGNKGVVSKIVPLEDMPFMEDGTPVDIVLNPLGVAARMNIGQILETNLGFASHLIGRKIDKCLKEARSAMEVRTVLNDILTDDILKTNLAALPDAEFMTIAEKYSRGLPFAAPVFEGAKVKTIEDLLESADGDRSGQVVLYDGQTGLPFDRKITTGYIYMLKLHHLVDNKIHARSTGTYSLVTQQPLGGKSHFGGQRFGEMECWALQSYGAAYTLQEMLTVKSDDVEGRNAMYESIVKNEMRFDCGVPESFNVLFKELRSLCFNVKLNSDD